MKHIQIIIFLALLIAPSESVAKSNELNVNLGISFSAEASFEPQLGFELNHYYSKYVSFSSELSYGIKRFKYDKNYLWEVDSLLYRTESNGEKIENSIRIIVLPEFHLGKRFFIGYGLGFKFSMGASKGTSSTLNIVSGQTKVDSSDGSHISSIDFEPLFSCLKLGFDFNNCSVWINYSATIENRVGINLTYKIRKAILP
jgi:hypothetical protein